MTVMWTLLLIGVLFCWTVWDSLSTGHYIILIITYAFIGVNMASPYTKEKDAQ